MASQLTAAVLAGATTTAVSLLGFVIQDQVTRRSRHERRKMLLDDALRRVTFATEWSKAVELVGPPPDELDEARARSLAWLNEASTMVPEVRPLTAAEQPPPLLSRALLVYRFERRSATVIRLCFYLILAWAILTAAYLPSDRGTPDFTDGVVALVVFGFLALLLRAWAVTVEKRRPAPARNATAPDWNS